MATFSVMDMVNKNKNLEISLNAWGQYHPAFMFSVREGTNYPPSAVIPVYYGPALLANLSDPINNSIVQIQNKSGVFVVGRRNNEFVVQINYSSGGSSNGEFSITINESQWADTYKYIELMYNNSMLIKEINNNIRNVVTGLLRSVGLDFKVNNRFKITPWWDDTVFKNGASKSLVQEIAEQVVSMMNNNSGGSSTSSMTTPIPAPLPNKMNNTMGNMGSFNPPMSQMPPKAPGIPSSAPMPKMPTINNGMPPISNNVNSTPDNNYNGLLNDAFGNF